MRLLKNENKKLQEESDKLKKKKDREITERLSEMERYRNELLIEKTSLESVIRCLIDVLNGIYCSLDIINRKKGKIISEFVNFQELIKNPS